MTSQEAEQEYCGEILRHSEEMTPETIPLCSMYLRASQECHPCAGWAVGVRVIEEEGERSLSQAEGKGRLS